ncbi:DNA-directed RNA polymerases II and IV subunit 5A [Elaeis guineensis]|uniref:DNA-directed RNA polymerases II and IV subunit 5A n=1 Tax=Elaeis guineensis var. tenera TaxID=51953 RepID=A0A6I9R8I1_ELAGV|nr:DNA-directed RNA polymerases II and IV subunit 5A [Elaeis guineensis]
MVDGALASTFFRIRRTILEMLRDRGFLVTDAEIEMTRDQFVEKFGINFRREVLDFSRSKRDDPSDMICVYFVEEKLHVRLLQTYLQQMNSAKITRAIFVVKEKPAAFLLNILSDIPARRLEVFMEHELSVNISKHVLVPKHELLTIHQKNFLLERYNVKITQLPRIQVADPVARYYGLVPGDVVKITRSSQTTGRYVTYRVAVGDGSRFLAYIA